MTVPAITICDISFSYLNKPVLWDIDATIPQGIMLAIIGPNGAGKTTLLQTILGITPPAAGRIDILGGPIQNQRLNIAYVPQRRLIDWDFPITVWDAVMMGRYGHLGWFKRPSAHDRQRCQEALDAVGLREFATRHISQLSGGQQQRVFIARALVQDAMILLLDEPFVGVDAVTERDIISILKQLKNQGKTIVVVHHDLHTLHDYFDWALLLNVRLINCGPVSEVITPDSLKTAFGGRQAAP